MLNMWDHCGWAVCVGVLDYSQMGHDHPVFIGLNKLCI